MQIANLAKPAPKNDEVLVKVFATTVASYDCWARSCKSHTVMIIFMRFCFGFSKPKQPILGTELANEVVTIGKDLTRLKIGEQIYACPGMKMGAYAEYVYLPEK